ncbi:ABC transporter permease [Galbibacter sp. EGI 63066]|uniref:ABC transporter permease n=1 Tax=Galbibacter sp. EGI 63066 TaxID=2993559 RepID=UPI0022492215|nr:ABC transporter permease [Galbibacter sp. EGI 63066]MCX2678378.1 ABC transporter permease [Galbibacter sp. EGI 63066]
MTIGKISLQNIKSKPLYTFLSVFILALSIALLLGIQQLEASFKYQMENNLGDIDLVIGAKGSPLQLVLASVLHLDSPTGNILYEDAKKISKNPLIKTAVPISYGDNYKGYRIVGTTDKFAPLYNAKLEKGRAVKKSMEVILGHTVAEQLHLNIGDTFLSSHGLVENNVHMHSEHLTVVGILNPTQKVIDRLIITNLESVWDVHHHDDNEAHEKEENHAEHHEELDEGKEITSLLISFRNPSALLTLPRRINEHTNMQAALPKYELDRLYQYTGVGVKTISWIAYMILIISCMTIFISLYKMVKERAFDLALLRTYGASNFQLIRMVVYEGLAIAFLAFILGFMLSKAGLYFMLKIVETNYKQNILQALPFQEFTQTGALVFVMIVFSVSLAIYPIIKMNISTILSNEK